MGCPITKTPGWDTKAISDIVARHYGAFTGIAAGLLTEQVLAPRFTCSPKSAGPLPNFDYWPKGYQEGKANVGVNEEGSITSRSRGSLRQSLPRLRGSPFHR